MESGQGDEREFGWVELTPDGGPGLPREDLQFRVFFVQVKSESESGQALHNDPIPFLRENIPEMQIPEEDVRAMLVRANAERSANPRHRSEVWAVIPGSTTIVGLQYKHPNDESY